MPSKKPASKVHDEPFALFRQYQIRGAYNKERFDERIRTVRDWNLFLAFLIIDGCTVGKSREQLQWFFSEMAGRIESRFTASDILP